MKNPPKDEPYCPKFAKGAKVRLTNGKSATGIVDSVRRIGSIYLDKNKEKQKGFRYLYAIKVDGSSSTLTNVSQDDLAPKQ